MSATDLNDALNFSMLEVGGRTIHLAELGEGEPVLMLHGGGPGASGVSNYSRNIEALAHKFRVLVPDMPGYGKSSKFVDDADPFRYLANSMGDLLRKLGIESAHIVGNSLGGACALRMALDNPAQTRSITLMGPGGINMSRGAPTKGLKCLLNYYRGDGPSREKLKEFIGTYLVYDPSNLSDELLEARYQSSIDPEVVANPPLKGPKNLFSLFKMDFTRGKELDQCEVPTLVLWGADDKVNKPSGGYTLQKRMPNCDLYMISRAGHWVQWEEAELFNVVTANFVERNS